MKISSVVKWGRDVGAALFKGPITYEITVLYSKICGRKSSVLRSQIEIT